MPRWKVGGFVIVLYRHDHPPAHVHVWKDNEFVGRYDLEHHCWIEGPYHAAAQARKAIAEWAEQTGLA